MHFSSLLAERTIFKSNVSLGTLKTEPDLTHVMCQDMQRRQGGDSGYYAHIFHFHTFCFFVTLATFWLLAFFFFLLIRTDDFFKDV